MNNHVEDLISAYLDNELSHKEKRKVERHIQRCSSCHQLLQDLSAIQMQIFSTYLEVEIPDQLEQKIMNAIHSKRMFSPWRWIGLSLASILAVVMVIVLLPWMKSGIILLSAGFQLSSNLMQIVAALVSVIPNLFGLLLMGSTVLMMLSIWSLRRLLI